MHSSSKKYNRRLFLCKGFMNNKRILKIIISGFIAFFLSFPIIQNGYSQEKSPVANGSDTPAGNVPRFKQQEIPIKIKKGDAVNIKKSNELIEFTDLTYAMNDNTPLKLDLYKPSNSETILPAVICVHGGGWAKGNRKGFANVAKAFANNGFVAVTIDYRLSDVAQFPAQIQDCKSAVRWMRLNADKYGIDTSRIGALGHSAGGHLSALLATSGGCVEIGLDKTVSDKIHAAVAMGAQTDFLSERTKEVSIDAERGQIWRQFLGGTQVEKPDVYMLASPLYHLDEKDPPIMFITGESDDSSTHASLFREKAGGIGVETRLAIIEDAPHNFLTDPEWFDLSLNYSISFLREKLK